MSARSRRDQAAARSATPIIQAVLGREQRRIAAIEAGHIEAYVAEATSQVSISEWRDAVRQVWATDPTHEWARVQAGLGTDLDMPASVARNLGDIGAKHGEGWAESQKRKVEKAARDIADRLDPDRDFRSSMRREMRATYRGWIEGLPDDPTLARAARISFTEKLQQTEMIRYESAIESAARTRHDVVKVWFTQKDSRVRPAHQRAEGQRRMITAAGGGPSFFNVGGERLRYPRDPAGSPAQVYGCRCWAEYRRVRKK